MAVRTRTINDTLPARLNRGARSAAAVVAAGIAGAAALASTSALALGNLGTVDIVSRSEGRVHALYAKDGKNWIVGTPGQEYGIRVCNTTGGRLLAVMSVDGVNILSGDTASPSQSGYVLDPHECYDVNGWRKSQSAVAAFYFTTLADAYATRTGRPDNLGVVGVAFFRERIQPAAWRDSPKVAGSAAGSSGRYGAAPVPGAPPASESAPAAEPPPAEARRERGQNEADSASAPAPTSPPPAAKIGTGHGRHESSYVTATQFTRESSWPNETIVINYDRRENLVAMGILPPPTVARSPNPFPGLTRYVPDPPLR